MFACTSNNTAAAVQPYVSTAISHFNRSPPISPLPPVSPSPLIPPYTYHHRSRTTHSTPDICTNSILDFSSPTLGSYIPYAYDAVHALARSVHAAIKKDNTVRPKGKALMDELKQVTFKGVTGSVAFASTGDREGKMEYSVFNHDGDGFQWIGTSAEGAYTPCVPQHSSHAHSDRDCHNTTFSTPDNSVPIQTVQELNARKEVRLMVSQDRAYIHEGAEISPKHGDNHLTAGILPALAYKFLRTLDLSYRFVSKCVLFTFPWLPRSFFVLSRVLVLFTLTLQCPSFHHTHIPAFASNTLTHTHTHTHTRQDFDPLKQGAATATGKGRPFNASLIEAAAICETLLNTSAAAPVIALVPLYLEDLSSAHPCMNLKFRRIEVYVCGHPFNDTQMS